MWGCGDGGCSSLSSQHRRAFYAGIRPGDYHEQIRVLKAGVCLNVLAWDNEIGFVLYFVGFYNAENDE